MLITVIFCVQISVQAQNKVAGFVDPVPASPVKKELPAKAIIQKTEAQVLTNNIKKDVANRTKILLSTKELNTSLIKKFGSEMSISSEQVVAHMLSISNNPNQSILIRQEALKVLLGNIPAGHIFEEKN